MPIGLLKNIGIITAEQVQVVVNKTVVNNNYSGASRFIQYIAHCACVGIFLGLLVIFLVCPREIIILVGNVTAFHFTLVGL